MALDSCQIHSLLHLRPLGIFSSKFQTFEQFSYEYYMDKGVSDELLLKRLRSKKLGGKFEMDLND